MNKFLSFFTKKRIIFGVIVLAVLMGGYFLFFNKKTKQETLTVHPADFLQQVSASGKIVAKQNLDLSFEQSSIVQGVHVNVGDQVKTGQLLANQNTGQLNAQLSLMQAGIDLQKAKLDQLLVGASPEDIQTAQDFVTSAQQNLDNAYATAQTSLNSAYNAMYNAYTAVAYLQMTYFNGLDQESFKVQDNKNTINTSVLDAKKLVDSWQASLSTSDKDSSILHGIADLNTVYNNLVVIRQQCELDVYFSRVTAVDKTSIDTQKTNITTAVGNLTSNQSSIFSYKTALLQAQDSLALKKAPARTSDIAVYQAQIKQAQASEQDVVAQLNKKRIYSPINGIITAVNAKVGSISSLTDPALSVISLNNFQIESYVPEINISFIKVGQDASVSLDAYGADVVFPVKVVLIDPAETIKDGVSTYKVTLELQAFDDRIKSGMTGNVVMTTAKKSNVISVPQGIVIVKDGKKFVNTKNGDGTLQKEVQTGSISSSGDIEITSGLQDGDIVLVTP